MIPWNLSCQSCSTIKTENLTKYRNIDVLLSQLSKLDKLSKQKNPTEWWDFLSVASPRIELGSGASETLILSIVLRGQRIANLINLKGKGKCRKWVTIT